MTARGAGVPAALWTQPDGTVLGRLRCGIDESREHRLATVWASFDHYPEEEFIRLLDELAAELPADDPVGLFERGGACDSHGHSDLAVAHALTALAPHLPRYPRSVTNYARLLLYPDH